MEELEILPLHNAASGQEKHLDLLSYDGGSEASSAATFDNASVFSNQSTSTSQSSVYDPVGAAEDFIALLLSDTQLHPLFLIAREPIDQQVFRAELRQLLRRYSEDLLKEAHGPLDKTAIEFVRRYRRRIAYAVGGDAYQNDGGTSVKSNKDDAVITRLQHLPGLIVVQDSDSFGDETEHDEEQSNLQRVKNFLFNDPEFENFRPSFLEFILAGKESPPVADNPPSPSAANSDQLQ